MKRKQEKLIKEVVSVYRDWNRRQKQETVGIFVRTVLVGVLLALILVAWIQRAHAEEVITIHGTLTAEEQKQEAQRFAKRLALMQRQGQAEIEQARRLELEQARYQTLAAFETLKAPKVNVSVNTSTRVTNKVKAIQAVEQSA